MGTDGNCSFVINLYADSEIRWTISQDGSSVPAQVGYNAGDGIHFFVIPESITPEIINITSTSNVDIPGVWMFHVDQEDIGCTNNSSGMAPVTNKYIVPLSTICITELLYHLNFL